VTDDSKAILETYHDFDLALLPQPRGIKIELHNAPPEAFVDGTMIRGIREHLFSVLRDIVYANSILATSNWYNPERSDDVTNLVFQVLRNADILRPQNPPDIVVCWGGHPSAAMSTTTPRMWATSWACAGSTSAPAAALAP